MLNAVPLTRRPRGVTPELRRQPRDSGGAGPGERRRRQRGGPAGRETLSARPGPALPAPMPAPGRLLLLAAALAAGVQRSSGTEQPGERGDVCGDGRGCGVACRS